ncbi:MAG: phosphoadenosine phosphosulfate reductase family protein [Thermoplasmata archaeon]
MSKPVYLGKVELYWCDECNVPLINKKCSICNKDGRAVTLTPPGDVRPALKHDLDLLKTIFKDVTSDLSFLDDRVILLNRIPGIDRSEEIIIDGYNIGNLQFDLKKYKLSLKLNAVPFLNPAKNWIKVDEGAVNPILNGSNLLIPGIIDISDDLDINSETVLFDKNMNPFAIGTSKINSELLKNNRKGLAVKVRDSGKITSKKNSVKTTWDKAVKANIYHLDRLENKALEEIKSLGSINKVVSFSGGKDSLVTLLLVLKSGAMPKSFFLNTGIEFPETIEYVKKIASLLNIDIDIIDAKNAFWDSLNHFGPPGKDYRWCCKACKLGPTTRYIKEVYKTDILTFVGQRSYESQQRAIKGKKWRNEWVSNQIGYSLVQHWNSLSIWLYIFKSKIPYNPWYDLGLARIGCYLCPSTDLADLEIVKDNYPGFSRWEDYLESYATEKKLPTEWVELGLWRWNHFPPWILNMLEEKNIKIEYDRHERSNLKLETILKDDKIIITFNKKVDLNRLNNMLNIINEKSYKLNENNIVVSENLKNVVKQVIIQAEECIGCGVCSSRCKNNAIYIENQKAWIDEKRCSHCSLCIGPCPVYRF